MAKLPWQKLLSKKLRNASRVAILGVGSDLRGDDIAGILVVDKLKRSPHRKYRGFAGGTAPENFSGEIKKYNPTHLVIVDAAETGKRPGTISLFEPDEIEGVSFSTHTLPLKVLVNYLQQFLTLDTLVIGIQPSHLEFNHPPSKSVQTATDKVAAALSKSLSAR